VPSDTTRSPRPGEKDGIDFYFSTDYDQVVSDIKAGHFLQVAIGAGGDLYATRASSYPSQGMAVMPVMADVVPIFRKLGFAKTISTFITPPSYQEWMRRIKSHPVTPEQLIKRLAEAKRSLNFALKDAETHFILNDDLPEAVLQAKQLVQGETDANREELARKAAQEMPGSIN
jgi:guanylate kinase